MKKSFKPIVATYKDDTRIQVGFTIPNNHNPTTIREACNFIKEFRKKYPYGIWMYRKPKGLPKYS